MAAIFAKAAATLLRSDGGKVRDVAINRARLNERVGSTTTRSRQTCATGAEHQRLSTQSPYPIRNLLGIFAESNIQGRPGRRVQADGTDDMQALFD